MEFRTKMPSIKIKVKWGREIFQGIEVDTDSEPLLFKAQLFALTGVQPDRQKVMFKGNILKDSEWNLQLKEGAMVLLLGTKDQVPEVPTTPVKFIEDMNSSELETVLDIKPSGLTNLGNTCYMNATVQCLKSIPELCESLNQFELTGTESNSISVAITSSMKFLFKQMEKTKAVTPILLLQNLFKASPQFSQTGENGAYRQQDANECWLEFLKLLQQLPAMKDVDEGKAMKKYKSFIEQYFGGTFEVKMHCAECPEEKTTASTEQFLQLSCFISPEVRNMHSGLKLKMKEQLTKYSESLGRDASFNRCYLISRLPAYLTVQFVRFQYKGKEGINAKILKDIKFPLEFDAYDLCTAELQEKLYPMRAKFKEMEDKEIEKIRNKATADVLHSVNDEKSTTKKVENYWFEDDLGSNNSGYYTLKAVLTHKGRSSSSGHYVAWVRENADIWFKMDDDVVSSVTTDEILRLSGGGDWHCAYVLVYGPRVLNALESVDDKKEMKA